MARRSSSAPDIALTAAVVTVIYLLVFFGGATALFRDADAGWHITAGEQMLATRSLPHFDPFSFPKAGQPWIAWEWGSDVLVALAHRAAGLTGVAFVYTFAIASSVWMWFKLNWVAGGNFLIACLFASPMLSTVNLHWLARPHVFSWLFLLGWVCFFESKAKPNLIFAALFTAVWANIHGSFFLAPIIALIYGAWPMALASAVGSLLTPSGFVLQKHVWTYLTDSALLDRIGEFQSFNFHAPGSTQIILALLIGICGGTVALFTKRTERFVLSMLLSAAAIRSARMLPVAALLLLPLANGSISALLQNEPILKYGDRLRAIDRRFSGLILVPVLALFFLGIIHATRPGFPSDQFPVAAAASVAALPATARLFAPDKFGGYLIYRFGGTRKVFFDGRSDFYGADFLKRYSRMVQVRPGWREEFGRWKFTHALLPVDYSLVPALESEGWKELYRDKTAVLLVGNQI